MKKSFPILLLISISTGLFAQTESFDSGAFPPSSPFSITNPIGPGNAFSGNVQWYRSDDPVVNGQFQNNGLDVGLGGTGNCVVMNSEEWCCGWQADLILSGINLSAYAAPRLKFYIKHPDGEEQLFIDVDGGSGYSTYGTITSNYSGWTPVYIDLSAFSGNPSVDIRFRGIEGSGSSASTNVGIDEIVIEEQTNMAYVSSTTTQTGCALFQGGNNQPVIRVEVVTSGSLSPLIFNQMTFNMNGTTIPSDIDLQTLYYTGTDANFNTSYEVGSSTTSGTFTIFGAGVTLNEGSNYFWLTYDIPYSATFGNSFDAECTNVNVGSTSTAPSVTAPAGVLTLNNSNVFYVSNLNNSGAGSLRSAVAAANAYGCDAIVDVRGINGTIVHGASMNISTSNHITILGPGADKLTVDGGSNNFIYHFGSGLVTIEGFKMETFSSEPIYAPYGNVEIKYCWFDNNTDGACYFPGGDVWIWNSTFSNNSSAYSGAIYFPSPGTMRIYNSTFFANLCTGSGGAIYNPNGTIILEGCTFKDNMANANQGGGAIKNFGTINALNTTFDNNQCPGSGKDVYGTITMNYSHMSSPNGATISGANNILSVTANLNILNQNGGPTPTCDLSPTSMLIDAGGTTLLSRDQRDFCRTSLPDMGAFEFSTNAPQVPSISVTLSNDTICANETITVTASYSNAGVNPSFHWLINGQIVASGVSSSYTFNGSGLTGSNYLGVIIENDNVSSCTGPDFGYSAFVPFIVKPNPQLNATANSDTLCEGETLLLSSNVTPPSTPVTWDNNVIDNNPFIPLIYGTVIYTVSANLFGCSAYDTVIVSINELPDPVYSVADATCGQDNGSIVISSIPNATGPFTYQWTNGDNSATTDSLPAGLYQVNIVSGAGCENDITIYVNNNNGPAITAQTITNVTCPQGNNGAIDITVTGGSGSLMYEWNTGSIVQDISNLPAGVYDVTITDTSGCQAAATYVVTQPLPIGIIANTTLPTCGNSNGSITVNVVGGTSPYTYLWDDPSSQTTATASSLTSGIYHVLITDANGCTKTKTVVLNNGNGPSVVLDSIVHVGCGGTGGAIYVSITGGSSPYTFLWSNSDVTEDISGLLPGNYSLEVTDGGGCTGVFDIDIETIIPDTQQICMVTVDSLTQTNLVIWEKQMPANGIAYYNIYREGSVSGNYLLVDTISYSSLSQYTDTVANPQVRAWRYKIAAVDSCGNESPLSIHHKTIHLTANLGVGGVVNLSWGDYEGFSYPTYYINRYHISTGWEVLDSLPNTLATFTDPTPPAGAPDYAITIVAPYGCDPSRAGVNTSRSNIKNQPAAAPNSITENKEEISFSVYPNPARDEVFITINNFRDSYLLKVYNSIGELVFIQTMYSNQQRIDTRSLPTGLFYIEIFNGNQNEFKKLVINR